MFPLLNWLASNEDYAPDPDQLQQELVKEATRWEYISRRNWIDEILDFIFSPLKNLGYTSVNTTNVLITIFFAVILIALIWWAVRSWRPRKKNLEAAEEQLLIDPKISPEEYHQRALALRESDPDEAVKNAFRCAVATLDRAEIIIITPGRTAGEVSLLMRKHFPDLTETIKASALAFDTAAYATQPPPRVNVNDVNIVLILADALRTRVEAKATAANVIPTAVATPQWEVSV